MIDVSPELKQAFNPNNGQGGRYIDHAVTWGIINQEAQENAKPWTSVTKDISRIQQITQMLGPPVKIASFEGDGLTLDGSAVIPPTYYQSPDAKIGHIGFDASRADGTLISARSVDINFDYYFDWVTLTISFGHVIAVDFKITYYTDAAVIHTTKVVGNTLEQYADEIAITNCNKVAIAISKVDAPFSFPRISDVIFGTVREYNKNNSETLEITEQIDILNERLPINEMKLSVNNFAAEYNIFDPSGIFEHLRSRQKFDVKIGAQQQDNAFGYVNMGSYYLQSPELKNNFTKINLNATNILGVLQDTSYTKGVFKTATIEEFLNDVAGDAGVQVTYPTSLADLNLPAYIPSVSHAEAFRRIAQATNTILYVDRNNVITFKEPDRTVLQMFSSQDYKEGNGLEPSDESIINTIEVESVGYAVNSTTEKLADISGNGIINVKYDASTSQALSLSSGTLVFAVFYADNAVLEVVNAVGQITGKKISATTKTVSATNAQANEAKLIYKVNGNPFIQSVNSPSIAEHYLAIRAAKRRTIKMNYRGYPYIEMGDCINFVADNYVTKAFGVSKNSLKLGGGMTGTLEAREI